MNYACIMAAGSPPRVVQALDDAYSRLQELMPVEFPAAQSGASKTRRHDARLAGGGQTPTRCWAISRGEGAARAGVRTSRPAAGRGGTPACRVPRRARCGGEGAGCDSLGARRGADVLS